MAQLNLVKRGDLFKVKFSQLELEENLNFRKDYGDSLVDSIRENGVIMPLRGYRKDEKFVVTDGHRRYGDCKILYDTEGLDIEVKFILEAKGTTAEQRIVDMFMANDGKPFNMLEIAEGIRRLIAYGWTEKQIAKKLGRSESSVNKINLLNSAPKLFTNLIEKDLISATLAIKIIQQKSVDDFMEKYNTGGFVQGENNEEVKQDFSSTVDENEKQEDNTKSLPAQALKEDKATAPVKIKPKDIAKENSILIFKRLSKKFESEKFNDQQILLNDVISKMINNEYSEEEIMLIFETN